MRDADLESCSIRLTADETHLHAELERRGADEECKFIIIVRRTVWGVTDACLILSKDAGVRMLVPSLNLQTEEKG